MFEKLEECPIEQLNEREMFWLSKYVNTREVCYNHDYVIKLHNRESSALSEAIKLSWEQNPSRRAKTAERMRKTHAEQDLHVSCRKTRRYINPTGDVVVVSDLAKFCSENGLAYESMRKLAKGQFFAYQGWLSGEVSKVKKEVQSRKNTYVFSAPDSALHETKNIAAFARKHNLDRRCVFKVISGKLSHAKGWKFVTLKEEGP